MLSSGSENGEAAANVRNNSTFQFVDDAPWSRWTIDGFIAEGHAGSSAGNRSRLDVSELGVASFANLSLEGDGSNTIITPQIAGQSWEIELVGVSASDLASSQNFNFA